MPPEPGLPRCRRSSVSLRWAAQNCSAPLTSSVVVPVASVVSPAPAEPLAGRRTDRDVMVDRRDGRVRLPAPCFFRMTGEVGLRFDGEAVAWFLKNAEPFAGAASSANSGSLPVALQQRRRGRKRKKPLMLSISSVLTNADSEPVERVLKKKIGRRSRQNLQIAYHLKASKALE